MTNRLAPEFLRRWHATDVAWPAPADALQACRENASTLRHHGVNVRSGVDAFNILEAVASLGIRDPNSIGLVLWSGPHPRRHDGRFSLLQQELQHLRWTRKDFVSASVDAMSSALPQATVIACDDGNWANNIIFGLDLKPLPTFRTQFGQAGSSVFRSAAAWPDCKDSTGCRPLHLAAKTDDNIEVVRLLCEAGAAKDLRTNRGETALLTAVDNWALCIAGFLCESGACTNLADNMGWTALGLAVKAANVASVRSLVRAGAKVNGSASPNGMIPLALLIVHAHLALSGIGLTSVLTKIASLLCEAGAAWGDKMPDGRTPLEIAYKTGHEETDRFFVPLEMQQAGNG